MNLKDQVLSIEQVQELQELGFDVKKYASVVLINEKIYIRDDIKCLTEQFTYSLTIGDIIEVLPKKKEGSFIVYGKEYKTDYKLTIDNKNVAYICRETGVSFGFFEQDKLINSLFETLKWCIANKHITI